MAVLNADCPRCGYKKMTFDVTAQLGLGTPYYDWQPFFELFCICRHCHKSVVFVVASEKSDYKDALKQANFLVQQKDSLNQYVKVRGFIKISDFDSAAPPDHLPPNLDKVFREGSSALSILAYNAAGTMFRLCVDLATRDLLPQEERDGLNKKVRRDLGLRLPWLFDNGLLPQGLRELSSCIREDGNDGAHQGSLTEDDAKDLLDFTYALLERLYTEPKKLELANARRQERRKPEAPKAAS